MDRDVFEGLESQKSSQKLKMTSKVMSSISTSQVVGLGFRYSES
jgi:hypothetical protein